MKGIMRKRIIVIAAVIGVISAVQAQAMECEVSTGIENERQILKLDITGDGRFENIAVRILAPNSSCLLYTSRCV